MMTAPPLVGAIADVSVSVVAVSAADLSPASQVPFLPPSSALTPPVFNMPRTNHNANTAEGTITSNT
jgi:hypothetical protein